MRSAIASVSLFGLLYGLSTTASAAEVTRVASSFEEEDPFDLHFGVGYAFDFKKAAILREWSQQNGDCLLYTSDAADE